MFCRLQNDENFYHVGYVQAFQPSLGFVTVQEIQNKKTENNNNKKQRRNLDSGAFRVIYANKKKAKLGEAAEHTRLLLGGREKEEKAWKQDLRPCKKSLKI